MPSSVPATYSNSGMPLAPATRLTTVKGAIGTSRTASMVTPLPVYPMLLPLVVRETSEQG